jgi:CheY-like chemotaxis protein
MLHVTVAGSQGHRIRGLARHVVVSAFDGAMELDAGNADGRWPLAPGRLEMTSAQGELRVWIAGWGVAIKDGDALRIDVGRLVEAHNPRDSGPLSRPAAATLLREGALPPSANACAGNHVLLAEDDDDLRELLAVQLRRRGYQVTALCDGNALMDQLGAMLTGDGASALPDLVVSDIRMPNGTGLDVLAFLRCLGWRLPVVLITAFGDDATHLDAAELGAAAVLDKPFTLADLDAVVARLLAPRNKRRDVNASHLTLIDR